MKKYLKIILWTISAVIFVGFMIALAVLNNSGHGKLYTGVAKGYGEDDKISSMEVSVEIKDENELVWALKYNGEVSKTESLYFIEDGELYLCFLDVDDSNFSYLGEISAYEIEIGVLDGVMIGDLKCSKNITLRNVFVTFMVIGILGLLANTVYVVFEVLKKKGIIKVKEKPSKDIKNNSEENAEISVEENIEKVDN